MDSSFGVDNLLVSAFLNDSGMVVKISSENFQDRSDRFMLF